MFSLKKEGDTPRSRVLSQEKGYLPQGGDPQKSRGFPQRHIHLTEGDFTSEKVFFYLRKGKFYPTQEHFTSKK